MLKETIKIEDKKVGKDYEVDIISVRTLEALLIFLGIEPDDSKSKLDKKMNSVRIEI